MMEMSGCSPDSREFNRLREFLEKNSGIILGENKDYLVRSRLAPLLQQENIPSFSDLIDRIEGAAERRLRQAVIDAMTTNETLWFRDEFPFEYLKKTIFPECSEKGGMIKIWSAACSSGQEPYSISMCVEEYCSRAGNALKECEITATDLSSRILEQAREGCYELMALNRGLNQERLKKYFIENEQGQFTVKPNIRDRVRFSQLNLQDSFNLLPKFDVIFCRNVMIYFSSETKADILRRMHKQLKPGGYLFLGASESPGEASDLFEMIKCHPGIVYRAITLN